MLIQELRWHKSFLLSADRYLKPLPSEQHLGNRSNPTDIPFNGAYEIKCDHKESILSLEFMNINKIRPILYWVHAANI